MIFFKGFCFLALVCSGFASPQRNDQLINDRIMNVFGGQSNPSTDNRGGFGDIVLPEPENLSPTETPQFLETNGQPCKCVPYSRCMPQNNPRPATSTTDNRFFGDIDVR